MRAIELHFPTVKRFELFTGNESEKNLSFYEKLGYVPFKKQLVNERLTLIFLEK